MARFLRSRRLERSARGRDCGSTTCTTSTTSTRGREGTVGAAPAPLGRTGGSGRTPRASVGWEPYPLPAASSTGSGRSSFGPRCPMPPCTAWRCRRATSSRLEYHLLGNHLLPPTRKRSCSRALVLRRRRRAPTGVRPASASSVENSPEQILADGGHFERSPMYHAIVLGDVLDLRRRWPAFFLRSRRAEVGRALGAQSPGGMFTAMVGMRCVISDGGAHLLLQRCGVRDSAVRDTGAVACVRDAPGTSPPMPPAPDGVVRLARLRAERLFGCGSGPLVGDFLDAAPVGPGLHSGPRARRYAVVRAFAGMRSASLTNSGTSNVRGRA